MEVTNPLAQAEAALQEQLKAAQKQVDDIQAMINGIRSLQKKEPVLVEKKGRRAPRSGNLGSKPKKAVYPTKYSEATKTYQKVYVALYKLKSATVHDIIDQLKELDPKKFRNKEFTRKFAANGLHQLLNVHKQINAQLEGKNYVYSI